MNNKPLKTIRAVFSIPTKADIAWSDIEALFRSLGAIIKEGAGSRVRIELNGTFYVYHRPHPQRAAVKGAVESAREQLKRAGVNDAEL